MLDVYERRVGRKEAAQFLTERGYRTAPAILAKLALLATMFAHSRSRLSSRDLLQPCVPCVPRASLSGPAYRAGHCRRRVTNRRCAESRADK